MRVTEDIDNRANQKCESGIVGRHINRRGTIEGDDVDGAEVCERPGRMMRKGIDREMNRGRMREERGGGGGEMNEKKK